MLRRRGEQIGGRYHKGLIKFHASRVTAFLGLQRNTVGVPAIVVLLGMEERMAERFLPIYMLALGGDALAIGFLQAMDKFLSALYSFPGGYLSDRIGMKKSFVLFNLVAMGGFALVILIPTLQAVLIGAAFFISWSAIFLPASMSLIFKVLPQNKRTMGVSMHSLVRRIPMALQKHSSPLNIEPVTLKILHPKTICLKDIIQLLLL